MRHSLPFILENPRLPLFILTSLFFLLLNGCSTTPTFSGTEEINAPEDTYGYYSGKERAGNFYCKQQTFLHPDQGNVVELIGMIHIADLGFYEQVQSVCDSSDLVLREGVSGRGDLYFSSLLLDYALANGDRMAGAMGCIPQGDALDASGENWEKADMSRADLTAEGSLGTEVLSGLLLPVAMLILEPWNLISQTEYTVAKARGNQVPKAAGLRHTFFSLMNDATEKSSDKKEEDKNISKLIPGIIEARNANLMKVFDERVQEPDCQSIVIPWGAAHNPDLERQILERGYEKANTTWHCAVAVKDLLEDQKLSKSSRIFYFPYVLSVNQHDQVNRWSSLFGLIAGRSNGHGKYFSLGYGHLFEWGKT